MSEEQPYAKQLSLERFLLIVVFGALPIGAVFAIFFEPLGLKDKNLDPMFAVIIAVFFSLAGGFVLAALTYLFYLAKNTHKLHMTEDDLLLGEVVLRESVGTVHFRTGRPWRFWEGDGGRLFLTNSYLIFKTHGGQPTPYTLPIALAEIADVRSCRILRFFPGGLRVVLTDGRFELFTFGAAGIDTPDVWAADILAARHRILKGRQDSEGAAVDEGQRGHFFNEDGT